MTTDAEKMTAAELGQRDGAVLASAVKLKELDADDRADFIARSDTIARQAIAGAAKHLRAGGATGFECFVYRTVAIQAFRLAVEAIAAAGTACSSAVH